MKIFILAFLSIAMLNITGIAYAAPNSNNPNTVADYTSGTHGVVGENDTHTGSDIVTKSGNSGNFQQWFVGESANGYEGDHSTWKNVGDSTSCSNGWDLVMDANQSWGDYLQSGNYCVKTNDFNPQQ
jgi:hypothetical protein